MKAGKLILSFSAKDGRYIDEIVMTKVGVISHVKFESF